MSEFSREMPKDARDTAPASADDFIRHFDEIMDAVTDRAFDKSQFVDETGNTDWRQVVAEQNRLAADFLNLAVSKPDQFSSVFSTEKGSVYFRFSDGRTVRFKRADMGGGEQWQKEPATSHLFFVDQATATELLGAMRSSPKHWFLMPKQSPEDTDVPRDIPVVPFGVGAIPFDFGVDQSDVRFVTEEHSGMLRILDVVDKETGEPVDVIGGMHIGNPVITVYGG